MTELGEREADAATGDGAPEPEVSSRTPLARRPTSWAAAPMDWTPR